MSINNFTSLDGVIIKEPEFSVEHRRYQTIMAVNERRRNKTTGNVDIKPTYHKIVAHNTKADLLNELTKKGTYIHIHGKNITDGEGNIKMVEVDEFDIK